MLGFLVMGALLWLAIILVAKDSDIHWFRPIWWLIAATIVSFIVKYLLVKMGDMGFLGSLIALFAYIGVVFYFLWNNYGGMGLPKIITILVLFFLLQLGYELFFVIGVSM